MKIFIIGNSGSGKSYLARHLAAELKCHCLNLDHVSFENNHYKGFKSLEKRTAAVDDFIANDTSWIIEGVYGDVFYNFKEKIDLLIYLDYKHELCEIGLRQRKYDPSMTDLNHHQKSLENFIEYTKLYYTDHNYPISKEQHGKLFDSFDGKKIVLSSRNMVNDYIENFKI